MAASAERSARLSPEASPVPIIALPISRMTARTSAKSRLMRPSFTIRSVMQATPEWSTWSAIAKASVKVVFSLATRNRFWFGMMISVSTLFCISMMPASAAGGDEHHVSSGQVIADLVDHLFGGGAADVRLGAGAETPRRLHAHLDD